MLSWNDQLAQWLEPLGHFSFFCRALGLLFLLDLAAYLPWFGVFFGHREPSQFQMRSRTLERALVLGWIASALALIFAPGYPRLLGSLFFYAVYRHYYIDQRWASVRRGGGAPGFMSHWAVFYLVVLQFAAYLDRSGWLLGWVWTMAKVDFAVIMTCAGMYKLLIGYLHLDGMEYGRVNPMWGYFWRFFRHESPTSLHIRVNNWLACIVELIAAAMMYFPRWQFLGGLAISLSFVYVSLLIRLGRLAWLMVLLPMLYHPSFAATLLSETPFFLDVPQVFLSLIVLVCCVFMALLPVVKVTQYLNLFANWHWPQPWQGLISRYANTVPITMWRVFTPDVTNFWIKIYEVIPATGKEIPVLDETTYSVRGWSEPAMKLRFLHVTESIALTSVFTTLKYFPSKPELFAEKLLTYARSLEVTLKRPVEAFRFEYVAIFKQPDHFQFLSVGDFHLDMSTGKVEITKRVPEFDFSAPSKYSPVRESSAPGTYERKS